MPLECRKLHSARSFHARRSRYMGVLVLFVFSWSAGVCARVCMCVLFFFVLLFVFGRFKAHREGNGSTKTTTQEKQQGFTNSLWIRLSHSSFSLSIGALRHDTCLRVCPSLRMLSLHVPLSYIYIYICIYALDCSWKVVEKGVSRRRERQNCSLLTGFFEFVLAAALRCHTHRGSSPC